MAGVTGVHDMTATYDSARTDTRPMRSATSVIFRPSRTPRQSLEVVPRGEWVRCRFEGKATGRKRPARIRKG